MTESISYKLLRPIARGVLYVANSHEIREVEDGAVKLAQNHYHDGNPIWSFFSHMSKDDGTNNLEFLAREFPNRSGRIVMPAAKHTHDSLKLGLSLMDIAYGVNWKPVTTQRTIKDYGGKYTTDGMIDYLKDAMIATERGGIVSAALQSGGDLPVYGEPTTVFSTLARMLKHSEKKTGEHAKVGIQFLGIIPRHSLESGQNAHGVQTLRRMRMNVGRFALLDEVWSKFGDDPRALDMWAHAQMGETLPDWYTKK